MPLNLDPHGIKTYLLAQVAIMRFLTSTLLQLYIAFEFESYHKTCVYVLYSLRILSLDLSSCSSGKNNKRGRTVVRKSLFKVALSFS